MRNIISFVIGSFVIVGIVVFGLTIVQINEQKKSLSADLEYRTTLLADSLKESVEPYYINNSMESLQKVLNKFADGKRLIGLAVFDNKGEVVASSQGLSKSIISMATAAEQAMDTDKNIGIFAKAGQTKIYEFAEPLHKDGVVAGALMLVQRADYIDASLAQTWQSNLLRLILQVILFSVVSVLVWRYLILKPIVAMVESIKQTRSGKSSNELDKASRDIFFKPLAKEISKLSKSLFTARSAASEEARLRMEKVDAPWTAERLKEFVKAYLRGKKIFVVSNREPYVHNKVKNVIQDPVSVGGMVTAIEPIMEACGGMWMAQAMGNADKETADAEGKLQIPADDPKYTLKRIWLTEKEQKGFYNGFSNEALWPLCHTVHNRPIFRKEDWQEYRRVNGKFAQSLLAEIRDIDTPLILVQDFHLALLPEMIKKSRPDAQVALFWHIPWPSPETFNICPWKNEILEGMLGADVLGFHTQQYCNNFMETVAKYIESMVDEEQFSIMHDGHLTSIKPFSISIAFTNGNNKKEDQKEEIGQKLLEKFGISTKYIGLGADRLDYTKGILERFKAVEYFLDHHPNYKKQFTFLQIAPPSREGVEKYREFNKQVTEEAGRINLKFSVGDWKPIVLIKEHLSHDDLYPLYRKAGFCLVTPLHDGMNLVSKEFVAARSDESGVLILSQFAGASKDLKGGAIIVNPYSAEEMSAAIYEALNMPATEKRRRMKKMRESVKNYNVYRWAAELIKAAAGLG
ncbi:MAG: trehalose-6-phosphate synthase [Candidatus Staskawiczbacteria bacterium]|nr:trehalose-6-phosphate synthase [Candidatus Staskawiczbacteria bacterium]